MKKEIIEILERFNKNISWDNWNCTMGISENDFDELAEELIELFENNKQL